MKTFDCRLAGDIPELEIEASNAIEAKHIYIAAVLRAITVEMAEVVEADIVE